MLFYHRVAALLYFVHQMALLCLIHIYHQVSLVCFSLKVLLMALEYLDDLDLDLTLKDRPDCERQDLFPSLS